VIDEAIAELVGADVSVAGACAALGRARATHYRRHSVTPKPPVCGPPTPAKPQPRALAPDERQRVLDVLHEPRFVDKAPRQVWAELLDEDEYFCSVSTMYRLLAGEGETRERRRQATHPATVKPELVATAPNQVWSWDISKLRGPAKWTYYYLYVVIDVYSRYVVGWMVATRESAKLAERLLADTIAKQQVSRDQLTIHADRGSSMASKPVAFLLADLGVTKSHSRPHCSNDNPYSEANFKTLKYWPQFPERFGCIQDARVFCRRFFAHYNCVHRHSGIGLLTPSDVHHGRAPEVRAARAAVLARAYQHRPDRFVRKPPEPPALPAPAWINKPEPPRDDPQADTH
jgi:putative transposase